MKELKSYEEIQSVIENNNLFLLYAAGRNCGVCQADSPRIKVLADKYGIETFAFFIEDVPMASGQLSIYTAPTVMIYYSGSEYHRQSRIIDFRELEHRISQLVEKR